MKAVRTNARLKAFRTVVGDIISIVYADTASQARYDTYRASTEAGYPIEFRSITVLRAYEFDADPLPAGLRPRSCYCPETARKTLEAAQ